jgi:hypothetical protein
MFIDNKDQFKRYQRAQDRSRPMGLAKYALRLVGPLIEPAMQRSIGMFVQQVAGSTNNRPGVSIKAAASFGVRYVAHVVRSTTDGVLESTRALLEDLIEDTRDGILRVIDRRNDEE